MDVWAILIEFDSPQTTLKQSGGYHDETDETRDNKPSQLWPMFFDDVEPSAYYDVCIISNIRHRL